MAAQSGSDAGDSSFPQPTGPPSIISSRMTDIASENGDEVPDERPGSNRLFPGDHNTDPISRPSTAATARTGISSARGAGSAWGSQAPPSRRGLFSARSGSNAGSVGIGGGRPGSSASRTHAPVAAHGFYRPMSSQRLQAQRSGRFMVNEQPSVPENLPGNRTSMTSNGTITQMNIVQEPIISRPGTRDTEATERDGLNTGHTSISQPFGGGNKSESDSVSPLRGENAVTTLHVDSSRRNRLGSPVGPHSPKSFRSSFLLPNRGGSALPDKASRASSQSSHQHFHHIPDTKELPLPALGKNWEYFPGNTLFCFGGRWQTTRDKPINIATGALTVIPGVLFFIFSAKWLWFNVNPAVVIIFAYIYILCLSSFLHACVSDPGILPRNLHLNPVPENDDPLAVPVTNDWANIKQLKADSNIEVPTKYCKTCMVWRPPRTHHCRTCNNCVEGQDHHCVWLNNCIGRRNYRYFFTYISSATLLGLYLTAISLVHILKWRSLQKVSFGTAINQHRVPFAMVFYGVVAALYPAMLLSYHFYLVFRGETTREHLNGKKFLARDRLRPYSRHNVVRNFEAVLCRPRQPTFVQAKKRYITGDQRFNQTRGRPQQTVPQPSVEMGAVAPTR